MHSACLNNQFSNFKNYATSRSHGPTKLQGSDLTNNLLLKLFIIIIIITLLYYYKSIIIRVCHPNDDSYKDHTPEQVYCLHENEEERMYERRLLEAKQASFMPLVFTTTGGMDANVYDIIADSQAPDQLGGGPLMLKT